jgi:hypothetical protein
MLLEAFRCMECGCKSVFECDLKRYASRYGIDVSKYAGRFAATASIKATH